MRDERGCVTREDWGAQFERESHEEGGDVRMVRDDEKRGEEENDVRENVA